MQLVSFAIPLMVENIFQLLYNTADTIIVGRYIGDYALSAVGATSQVIYAFTLIFFGLSSGGTVIIAQLFGAKDFPLLEKNTANLFSLALTSGFLLMLFSLVFIDPILRAVKTPDDIFQYSEQYLRLYILGIPATAMFSVGSGTMRAVGNSRSPVYILVFSSLLNIILDLLFTLSFSWEITGVALATVISQYVSAGLLLFLFSKADSRYHFTLRMLTLERKILLNILCVSAPQVIERTLTGFSNIFVQSYINYFGSVLISSFMIYTKIESFAFMLISNISVAVLAFSGQNSGAKQYGRLKKGMYSGILLSLSATVICAAPILTFRHNLVSLFTTNADICNSCEKILLWLVPCYCLICIYLPCGNFLKGIGSILPVTSFMFGSFVIFKQVYLFFATRYIGNSPFIVLSSYPLGWLLCALLTYGYYLYKSRKTNFEKLSEM